MKGFERRRFLKALLLAPAAILAEKMPFRALARENQGFANADLHSGHMRSESYQPAYIALHKSGELRTRGQVLHEMMRNCNICPRECGTNRLRGRRGECNANARLQISSAYPHFGEETELVGNKGSGTVFFSNCSLKCVFCINYDISHHGKGNYATIGELADMMLGLQRLGCHNINLVTPSHYLPHIFQAIDQAAGRGLRLPLVYNTCGWEKPEIMDLLNGLVDVYLADFKYGDTKGGHKYSEGAGNYTDITRKALLEMHRQTGNARPCPDSGLINRGLMIRHLVMPNNAARSDLVFQWIAENLPKDTYVNILSQYTPVFRAFDHPEIARRIRPDEYSRAVQWARQSGLTNIKLQMH